MDFIYNIAGLILKIDGPAADLGYIEGFDLFKIPNEQTITPDITISTGIKIPDWRFSNAARLLHTQEFEGIECTLWRGPETYFFRMSSPEYGTACFIYNAKSCTVTCDAGAEISSGGGKAFLLR